jgi:hypothetical protein
MKLIPPKRTLEGLEGLHFKTEAGCYVSMRDRQKISSRILSGLLCGHLASPNQDKIHPEDLVRESLLITDMLFEWSEKDPKELPRDLFKKGIEA